MKVAILGCGPAGLISAHAAQLAGAEEVTILSKRRKSHMFGAQYLHAPIQGISDDDPVNINYILVGSFEEYRKKVYGDKWDGEVSPESLLKPHLGWDIRAAYDVLWERWKDSIVDVDITPGFLRVSMPKPKHGWTFISTLPSPLLCTGEHTFRSEDVWAMGDREPVQGGGMLGITIPANSVLCNGRGNPRWYRISNTFGYMTVEWPDGAKPPLSGVARVSKPLDHNCSCFPEIVRTGRYGAWRKGELAHESFGKVFDLVKELS